MKLYFEKIELRFLFPAGTSRGVLHKKPSWILKSIQNPKIVGECSVIPGLNKDYESDFQYEAKLKWVCETFEALYDQLGADNLLDFFCRELAHYPSILFGVESLFYQMKMSLGNDPFESAFSKGDASIPINGLIWMGSIDEMKARVREKMQDGFTVLKFKIGALDFQSEYKLLSQVRQEFGAALEIRVDANGAFDKKNVKDVLAKLEKIDIHSIEQPIRPGQWELMRSLCEDNRVPVALDEELIGIHLIEDKMEVLESIRPQYIILKPSLHGGLVGALEWISLAKKMDIGWWITSALESSIGLEIIARMAGFLNPKIPQGLGTGGLFENNFESPLVIENGTLKYKNV
jgi:o-succinylbenzoate synthase